MLDLSKILDFVRLLDKFRKVERALHVTGEDRFENDVEHSYHLAMLAWYIIESHNLNLDRDKVLKYALIHDFVEVHAGDTYIYSTDKDELDSKEAREAEAATKLKEEFPEFNDLHDLIDKYEKRNDKESRFIYALDKIQPVLNIYTDGGRTWKEKGITVEMLIDHKKDKVAISPEIELCFEDLVALLKKEEASLFLKK
jgi:putative hydrolase of HD superfamily